ncbi:MAG TPA: hypothetical protein PLG73_02990 [Candidatus Sumerlaeota bacterium]|nr:hypothetical protein [Candidatus Sumerlaeota bacterium]
MGHHLFTHFQKAGLGCFWRLTVFLGMLAFAATAWCEAPAAGNILIGPGGRQARILVSPPAPLARLMAGRLADYLEQRTGVRPQLISALPKEGSEGVVFLLARADDQAVGKLAADPALALPDMKAWREDGYALRTLAQGKTQYVLCAGKGDSGVKYAVYRLMRAMSTKDRHVSVPPLKLEANPFFRGRHATPSSAMAGSAPALLQKHYAWENWDISRLAAIPDFLDACGVNGVWLFDSPCRYDWTGNHVAPEMMKQKIRALAQETRRNGMTSCL